jgi:hypothetical protein
MFAATGLMDETPNLILLTIPNADDAALITVGAP